MLEKELQIYEANKADLKEKHQHGFVVIKDERILGVWQDRLDGIQAGLSEFGNVPFLVKDINESLNETINFSRPIKLTHAFS